MYFATVDWLDIGRLVNCMNFFGTKQFVVPTTIPCNLFRKQGIHYLNLGVFHEAGILIPAVVLALEVSIPL